MADVTALACSAREFINDTRTHIKRRDVLDTKKARDPTAKPKIDYNIFVRNEFLANLLYIFPDVIGDNIRKCFLMFPI